MFDVIALEELGAKIAGLDPEVASPEDLLAAAPALVRLGSQVKVGLGRVLAGLERRGICAEEFGLGPDGWLARETGAPKTECAKDLLTGRQVRRGLDAVEAAVVDGTLTCGPRPGPGPRRGASPGR